MAFVVSPLPAETHDESPMATRIGWCLTPRQEDMVDVLRMMLQQEQTAYHKPKGYCVAGSQESMLDPLTEAWRRRICEWIFQIVDHFSFHREVVWIALNYLDRSASSICESSGKAIAREDFQLLATSCLYLAIKLHGESDARDGYRLKMKISSFEELSRGLFTVDKIEATEQRLLSMLDWRLNQPTPALFLAYFIRLLPQRPCTGGREEQSLFQDFACEVYDVAKYLTELTAFDLSLAIRANPSIIAYGALLGALDHLASTTPWSKATQDVFLRNIARVDPSWSPFNTTVLMVKQKLKKISLEASMPDQPSRVEDDEDDITRCGKSKEKDVVSRESPTCVCDTGLMSNSPKRRKRARAEEPNTFSNNLLQQKQPIFNTLSTDEHEL